MLKTTSLNLQWRSLLRPSCLCRSGVPVIGASGAIAGVMGGYCVLFLRARIVALVPIFMFLRIVTIPAVLFLIFWFFAQLLNGMATSTAHFGGGVAWWAHVGGFAAGALMVLPLRQASGGGDESGAQKINV